MEKNIQYRFANERTIHRFLLFFNDFLRINYGCN